MEFRKHFPYADSTTLPSQFARFVSPNLRPLQRFQCQGCGCVGPHDNRHAPICAAGEHSRGDVFAEKNAFQEASRRAASRRASVLQSDWKAGRNQVAPAVYNCGLIAPEWQQPTPKEPNLPRWVENMSDYGTWSGSEPTTIVRPRGKSSLVLPPFKWCARCDPRGSTNAAVTASEDTRAPMHDPRMANWYPYVQSHEEVPTRSVGKLWKRQNSSKKSAKYSHNQQPASDINTTSEYYSGHKSNTGSPTPRTGMKTHSAEDTTTDGEVVAQRRRPRRPHTAAPAAPRTQQLDNERGSGLSASTTTVHSDPVDGSRIQSKTSRGTQGTAAVTVKEKSKTRGGRTASRARTHSMIPSGGTTDEGETKSWQGAAAEESEGGERPATSSGDKTYRRDEPTTKSGGDSSRSGSPATSGRGSSRSSTRGKPPSTGGPSKHDRKLAKKQIAADPKPVLAEKFEDPPVENPVASLPPEQNKTRRCEKVIARILDRSTIQNGSSESLSPFISGTLSTYGLDSHFPTAGPTEEPQDDATPSAAPETTTEKHCTSGTRQDGTVELPEAAVEATVPVGESTVAPTPEKDSIYRLDFLKYVDSTLKSSTRGNQTTKPTGDGSNTSDARQDGSVEPTAAAAEATVPAGESTVAPAPEKDAIYSVDLLKCVDLILKSSTRVNQTAKPTGDDSSGTQTKYVGGNLELPLQLKIETTPSGNEAARSDRLKKLAAEVTEQIVRAPHARGLAAPLADSVRDLTAADLSLSTTTSSDATESTGHCSSSGDARRRRQRSISKGRIRSSVSMHSHQEIAGVVTEQLKQVRRGVGQLEKLIKIQRLLEEDIGGFKTQNQPE